MKVFFILMALIEILFPTYALAENNEHIESVPTIHNSELRLSEIFSKLKINSEFHANFIQTKNIRILKSPILSKGNVSYSQNNITWTITHPIKTQFIITDDQITEISDNGTRATQEPTKNPHVKTLSTIIRSLIGTDINTLKQYFSFKLTQDNGTWSMVLMPKQGILEKIFRNITVEGNEHINSILMTENNSDTTRITFSEVHVAVSKAN